MSKLLMSIALIFGCVAPAFAEDAPAAAETPAAKEKRVGKLAEALKAHCEAQGLSKEECRAQIKEKCQAKGYTKEECKKHLRKKLRKESRAAATKE